MTDNLQEELKQVRTIFKDADINNCTQVSITVDFDDENFIYIYDGYKIYLDNYGGLRTPFNIETKDFNKILKLLQILKEMEEV